MALLQELDRARERVVVAHGSPLGVCLTERTPRDPARQLVSQERGRNAVVSRVDVYPSRLETAAQLDAPRRRHREVARYLFLQLGGVPL